MADAAHPGQEAQVVGATMALGEHDYMSGNHRSHGHPIGKGSPLGPLMAELVGKADGVCGGKGGSLHLADFNVGSLGESGIIGSSIPIATGAALSSKVLGNGRVALAFFGDGAANQGSLYESMNIAGVWKLPVIFLCENNQYALSTPAHTVTSGVIAERAMDQFVNQAAKNRYMFGGQASIPVVFRSAMFYGLNTGAHHSDRPYPMFMNVPGLKIMVRPRPRTRRGCSAPRSTWTTRCSPSRPARSGD